MWKAKWLKEKKIGLLHSVLQEDVSIHYQYSVPLMNLILNFILPI